MDTVALARQDQNVSVLGIEDDHWMDGLSAADVMRQFGLDPNVVISLEGKMLTPEGYVHGGSSAYTSGTRFIG